MVGHVMAEVEIRVEPKPRRYLSGAGIIRVQGLMCAPDAREVGLLITALGQSRGDAHKNINCQEKPAWLSSVGASTRPEIGVKSMKILKYYNNSFFP